MLAATPAYAAGPEPSRVASILVALIPLGLFLIGVAVFAWCQPRASRQDEEAYGDTTLYREELDR